MRLSLTLWVVAILCWLGFETPTARAEIYSLTAAGLGGDANYDRRFAADAERIHESMQGSASLLTGQGATRETILAELDRWAGSMTEDDQAVVVLIGHGSMASDDYRFNVAGPDLTGTDLAAALEALPAQRQVLINTTSASGALLERLAGKPGRVVITATKNGRELQATRFSSHFASALRSPAADLDKDRRINAAEAFAFAERAVADYFDSEGLLATEHPRQLGDNPSSLVLARLDDAASDAVAPELLARREVLNDQISALRARRSQMDQAEYLQELQSLLISLSMVSEKIEAAGGDSSARSGEVP